MATIPGSWDQYDDGNVHKIRSLPIEHRPIRRVLDRVTAANSLLVTYQDPNIIKNLADSRPTTEEERMQWKDEMLLELLNLEATMARIQLLRRSNARECERYAVEKNKILERASTIKSDTADLKVRLDEAQNVMELRREYDKLADKIASNRMLKPRTEQEANLEKLAGEIAELELESLEYKKTWAERREQFGRIVEEGKQMLRLIRDEKEEAERKEGMQGPGSEDDMAARGLPSGAQTPVSTVMVDAHDNEGHQNGDLNLLKPPTNLGSSSRLASVAATPSKAGTDAGDDDVEMGDGADRSAFSHAASEMEEGETEDGEAAGEGMDES